MSQTWVNKQEDGNGLGHGRSVEYKTSDGYDVSSPRNLAKGKHPGKASQ